MYALVITLGVLCVLFLVALIVVSIELGICKTRTNIPAVVTPKPVLGWSDTAIGQSDPAWQSAMKNKLLATVVQVRSASNLSKVPDGRYWIQEKPATCTSFSVEITGGKINGCGDSPTAKLLYVQRPVQ